MSGRLGTRFYLVGAVLGALLTFAFVVMLLAIGDLRDTSRAESRSGEVVIAAAGVESATLERARQIDTRLLREVRDRRARIVVVDVTGVPEIDTPVANQLLQTVTAVRLLGARVIMTGVSGELAEALVGLDIDFARLESYADLQRGVESATARR